MIYVHLIAGWANFQLGIGGAVGMSRLHVHIICMLVLNACSVQWDHNLCVPPAAPIPQACPVGDESRKEEREQLAALQLKTATFSMLITTWRQSLATTVRTESAHLQTLLRALNKY